MWLFLVIALLIVAAIMWFISTSIYAIAGVIILAAVVTSLVVPGNGVDGFNLSDAGSNVYTTTNSNFTTWADNANNDRVTAIKSVKENYYFQAQCDTTSLNMSNSCSAKLVLNNTMEYTSLSMSDISSLYYAFQELGYQETMVPGHARINIFQRSRLDETDIAKYKTQIQSLMNQSDQDPGWNPEYKAQYQRDAKPAKRLW